MMKIHKILIAAALASVPALAPAQQTKVLTADKHNEYGLVYTLPVTSVRFDVTARQTVRKAGPFYQYAKKYIGTDKVVSADSEQWEIVSVTATPIGTPDPDRQYLMQLKAGALTSICVDRDGMLLAINKEVDIPTLPSVPADAPLVYSVDPKEYLKYVNEDFLASKSSAKQAQVLSESLLEVRDARVSLTRGTADAMPTDGRQLEIMLNSLAQQEAAMTAAFSGTEQSRTVTRSFIYTPSEESGKSTLFRLSDFAGFVEADDYSGEPVFVTSKVTRLGELPVDSKGQEKALPKDAVVYNVPGATQISLTYAGRTLWQGEVECAQLGVQFGLLPSLFSDKKARSYAVFDPATGALLKIAEIQD